jgi:hypothetical protein
MAGRGTLESNAILALTETFVVQFLEQVTMTATLRPIIDDIRIELNASWLEWTEKITIKDHARIERKITKLSDRLPMDRPIDMIEMVTFVISTLEDFAKKLQPHKRLVINRLILAILKLHEYYSDPNNHDFDYLLSGAQAADAWEMEAIV